MTSRIKNQYLRFSIGSVLLILIVLFFDRAIGNLMQKLYFTQKSGLLYRTTYSIDSTKADILIFGSSRANHHYIPQVFENLCRRSCYNTGRDATGIFYQLAVLKCALERYSPKIIILDWGDSFECKHESYDRLSALLPYYKGHEVIQSIILMRGSFEEIKVHSNIYPYNSQLITMMIGRLDLNRKRKADFNGYVPFYEESNKAIADLDILSRYKIDPRKIEAFASFIHEVRKRNATLYVIFSPCFVKFSWNQDIEICEKLCTMYGIPFWDYSRDTSFQNHHKLFKDPWHLNNAGAIHFSNLIASRINQNYVCN